MNALNELSWSQRFGVFEELGVTDEQIMAALGIDRNELEAARESLEAGAFSVDASGIDVEAYAGLFVDPAEAEATVTPTTDEDTAPPATASQPERTPRKRGRKGTKILDAFNAVPAQPVDANAFAEQYGISLNVLRQAKRFDKTGLEGRVRVKKVDGTLSVFREIEEGDE